MERPGIPPRQAVRAADVIGVHLAILGCWDLFGEQVPAARGGSGR